MRRSSIARALVALMLPALVGTGRATASPSRAGEPAIAACIAGVSGNRAWLEKSLWGLYDQERGWVGAEIANRNGSHDLGPLQVNSLWVPIVAARLHRSSDDVRRWLRDDACFNVGVATWIFLSGYRQTPDYWNAVGAYHSGTRGRALSYARAVASRLERRYGAGLFVSNLQSHGTPDRAAVLVASTSVRQRRTLATMTLYESRSGR